MAAVFFGSSRGSAVVRIGIDFGGTKIEGIALAEDGAERLRVRKPTPRADYDAALEVVRSVVEELERRTGHRGSIGVATPGAPSRLTGRMKNCNSTWLNGRPLAEDLGGVLARDVRIANDADCFALSEATDGAGADAEVVFGVIVGTGTGGGIVVRGELLSGPNAVSGEWGHNPLPWPEPSELPGPACYCGRSGCIETWLSGPGLKADHARSTGLVMQGEAIVDSAGRGDTAAVATLERYCHRMARALASIINLLDPTVIVLGGGLSGIDRLYQRVPELWSGYVFSDRVDTPLLRPKFGASSGVRGAAWLWPHG
jgi:predicted NBD/HSP70 family sugar kinase